MTDFGRDVEFLLGIDPDDYQFYEEFADMLEAHEGRRNHVYEDSSEGKHWTIGIGHRLSLGLPDVVVDLLLLTDMQKTLSDCRRAVPGFDNLNQARQLVIASMRFNLGTSGLMGFKKMLAAIESQDFDTAADEMLDSKWSQQVKGRAVELAEIMRSGSISDEPGAD